MLGNCDFIFLRVRVESSETEKFQFIPNFVGIRIPPKYWSACLIDQCKFVWSKHLKKWIKTHDAKVPEIPFAPPPFRNFRSPGDCLIEEAIKNKKTKAPLGFLISELCANNYRIQHNPNLLTEIINALMLCAELCA